MDSQLEDFLSRFGDPEDVSRGNMPSMKKVEPMKLQGMTMGADGVGAKPTTGILGEQKNDWQMGHSGNTFKGEDVSKGIDMDKAGAVAGGIADAAPAAMGLLSSVTGKGFDTSAEGGGVGNGRGAILQGAAQGAELGKIAGPWGMAIGAAIGGGGTALAHGSAQREYLDNRQAMHKSNDATANAESRNRYAMENDEESMQIMKSLYKKQLGIV